MLQSVNVIQKRHGRNVQRQTVHVAKKTWSTKHTGRETTRNRCLHDVPVIQRYRPVKRSLPGFATSTTISTMEKLYSIPFTLLECPNLKLKKPTWVKQPSAMTMFAIVLLSYFLVTGGQFCTRFPQSSMRLSFEGPRRYLKDLKDALQQFKH